MDFFYMNAVEQRSVKVINIHVYMYVYIDINLNIYISLCISTHIHLYVYTDIHIYETSPCLPHGGAPLAFHWFTAHTLNRGIVEIRLPSGPSKGAIPQCMLAYVYFSGRVCVGVCVYMCGRWLMWVHEPPLITTSTLPLCSLLNDPSPALNKTYPFFICYSENPQLMFIFTPRADAGL